MPSFFAFDQGTETSAHAHEAAPLLGRFRAVPGQARRSRGDSVNKLFGAGYGALLGALTGGNGTSDNGDEAIVGESSWEGWKRSVRDLWIRPQQGAVRRCCDRWWSRWGVLIVLPAAIAVAWCALPFPQYPFPDDDDYDVMNKEQDSPARHKGSGHGQTRVLLNFWFFLFVYYGFYNITALMWVTKVFNIYSLNWWPQALGFPITVSIIAIISITVPIPMYFIPEVRVYLTHNTTWIMWTFFTMAMPVVVACVILMINERHIGLRQSLSETQRIFTSSWWTGEADEDTLYRRDRQRRSPIAASHFEQGSDMSFASEQHVRQPVRDTVRMRKLWIPASFMRFIWFCMALFIALIAYVLGEAYAEIYLQSLPHTNFETIVYVYSWVITIHLLDGITGWILGGEEGERVGSYPLGWIFKLYFSLTYQTYVRALYARLRSPRTFIYLQVISSTGLIVLQPLTMSATYHSILNLLGLNGQSYPLYQKYAGRSIFIRSLSENVSMLSFLGQVAVLHFGHNKDVYPYFAFDDTDPSSGGGLPSQPWWPGGGTGGGGQKEPDPVYDFDLTFWASSVTWACELTSAFIVRRIVGWCYGFNVNLEGRSDLGAWPELLPTGCVVMIHVLQNMIFGIVRLGFK